MLNFADCKNIIIFEVNKAIKGNVARRGNKRIGEDGSVARRSVVGCNESVKIFHEVV